MTAVESAPDDSRDTMAERRAAARGAYRASLAEGVPLTGAELGRRFGLSPRWGRLRVAEVHAEAPTGNGTHPSLERSGETPDDRPTPSEAETDEHDRGAAGRAEAASAPTNGSSPRPGLRTGSELPSAVCPPAAVTPVVRGITTLAVLAVALVAAVASYDHQRALAALAGEDWRAWLLPVSVDGLIVAASMSMLVRRRGGMPAGALAWGIAARRHRRQPGCQRRRRRAYDGGPGRGRLATRCPPAGVGAAYAGPGTNGTQAAVMSVGGRPGRPPSRRSALRARHRPQRGHRALPG
jgi:Protein of unknown function (DUF2637)